MVCKKEVKIKDTFWRKWHSSPWSLLHNSQQNLGWSWKASYLSPRPLSSK